MRIKIIGDNNCARATRHLLRLAGFAVTEFLPSDAVTHGPHAGYAITIDLAPAPQTPDSHLRPDPPTHQPHLSQRGSASIASRRFLSRLRPAKRRGGLRRARPLRQFILIRWIARWKRRCCGTWRNWRRRQWLWIVREGWCTRIANCGSSRRIRGMPRRTRPRRWRLSLACCADCWI